MASERQIAANRRNALKSTGPRTRAGKSRSARNSRKHGLSVSDDERRSVAADEIFSLLQSEYPSVSSVLLSEIALASAETRRAHQASADVLDRLANGIDGDGNQSKFDVSALDKIDRYAQRALSRKVRLMRQLGIEPPA